MELILAIDSSSVVASVAIVSEDKVIAEYSTNLKKTHSQTLMPMIDEIFKMTGLDKKDLKAVAITNGPGSFTGLRIGGATAKGIALALNIPVIQISTIEAMAYNINYTDKYICPIMDARRNQVYTGVYECKEEEINCIVNPKACDIKELIDELEKTGNEVIFLGDGIVPFKDIIDKEMKLKHYFSKGHLNSQRAGTIGVLAWKYFLEEKYVSSEEFSLEYFRLSQAERERMNRR